MIPFLFLNHTQYKAMCMFVFTAMQIKDTYEERFQIVKHNVQQVYHILNIKK